MKKHYPKYEVWGGYDNEYGEGDDPQHLEDCFTMQEAIEAQAEYVKQPNRYAFIRSKD